MNPSSMQQSISHPSPYEFALLAKASYGPHEVFENGFYKEEQVLHEKLGLKKWKFLEKKSGPRGFFAVAYWNEASHTVVVSLRGTRVLGQILTDMFEVIGNATNHPLTSFLLRKSHLEHAYEFVEDILEKYINNPSSSVAKAQLKLTGHSLGAWLAVGVCARFAKGFGNFSIECITFENPGAKNLLTHTLGLTEEEIKKLKITNFLSPPNAINTSDIQIGECFKITMKDIDAMKEPHYTKQAHCLDNILKTFDQLTGWPEHYISVTHWPVVGWHQGKINLATLFTVGTTLFKHNYQACASELIQPTSYEST